MMKDLMAGMPNAATDDKSIIAYFNDGMPMNFANGETIINDFNEPMGVYLIKPGFIKAASVSRDGFGNLLFIHQAGEFIPLPWALDGAHVTGLSYEAMTDVSVLRTSKDKLRLAMGHDAWLSQEILKQAVEVISVYTQRIQTLEFRSARERIISELLSLAERFGEKHAAQVTINAPITHLDIADSINMTRETASKALEFLFKEGLVEQKDHLFIILDLAKLQKALN
ncbi:MAG TPA: Crp/Fnr family transcriptional regulator [Candidatus Saccharimonadales bacterium]